MLQHVCCLALILEVFSRRSARTTVQFSQINTVFYFACMMGMVDMDVLWRNIV